MLVYVNVFDLSGYNSEVVFTNGGGAGFELPNDAVAYGDPLVVTGTDMPEPDTFALLGAGMAGVALIRRRPARG